MQKGVHPRQSFTLYNSFVINLLMIIIILMGSNKHPCFLYLLVVQSVLLGLKIGGNVEDFIDIINHLVQKL